MLLSIRYELQSFPKSYYMLLKLRILQIYGPRKLKYQKISTCTQTILWIAWVRFLVDLITLQPFQLLKLIVLLWKAFNSIKNLILNSMASLFKYNFLSSKYPHLHSTYTLVECNDKFRTVSVFTLLVAYTEAQQISSSSVGNLIKMWSTIFNHILI